MKFYIYTSFIAGMAFFSVSLFAQTQNEVLEQIQANYKNSLIQSDKDIASLVELLTAIPKETEMSDQAIVELHQRYPFDILQIKAYMDSIREDGSWPDINYADTRRSGWEPKLHAERILELAKLYNAEGPSCNWSPKISEVIHRAMNYWFTTKPICKNWWYNQIGIPKTLGPAFLLLRTQMTREEKKEAIRVMENARFGMTGQNKVWLAGNVLIKGLLQDDYALVQAARDTILAEITTGQPEGIKSDWSFHQHGPQQQFGNYGLSYLSEMSFYSGLFAGTTFALDDRQQAILNNLLTEGFRWVVWRGLLDVNSLDRQLFHQAPIHKAFTIGICANALKRGSSLTDVQKLQAFLDDNFASQLQSGSRFTGHKHFWDSDQTAHRTSQWMASVKMASDRVIGTELVNEDNLKGFYMADGATYTYCRGDEYLNIFPFWDWRKIPGITSYETDAPIPTRYGDRARNQNSFVGGVTDGQTGMTAMLLNRDGIKANKSWVFTDKFVLCLGSGIQSDSSLALTTSIDQRIKRGDLVYCQNNRWSAVGGTYTSTSTEQRFFHDNTGYIVMQPATCVAMAGKQTGKWSDFMGSYEPKAVEGETVSLFIRHDKAPASYEYLILPAVTPEETATFRLSDVRVVRNDPSLQAVVVDDQFYLSAYDTTSVKLTNELNLEIRTPGLYMISCKQDRIRIEASDPTHTQAVLSIRLNDRDCTIKLPAGYALGQSVLVTL